VTGRETCAHIVSACHRGDPRCRYFAAPEARELRRMRGSVIKRAARAPAAAGVDDGAFRDQAVSI